MDTATIDARIRDALKAKARFRAIQRQALRDYDTAGRDADDQDDLITTLLDERLRCASV